MRTLTIDVCWNGNPMQSTVLLILTWEKHTRQSMEVKMVNEANEVGGYTFPRFYSHLEAYFVSWETVFYPFPIDLTYTISPVSKTKYAYMRPRPPHTYTQAHKCTKVPSSLRSQTGPIRRWQLFKNKVLCILRVYSILHIIYGDSVCRMAPERLPPHFPMYQDWSGYTYIHLCYQNLRVCGFDSLAV